MGRAQVGLPGTPYSISDLKIAGAKRERRSKSSQQFSVDVPGLFFVALLVVFVLGHSRMTHDGALRLPQKYLFPEGDAENALIDVPYTLVRPGPCVECHRVGGCDATGQGCRTKALLPYRATCHGLAAEIDNTRS